MNYPNLDYNPLAAVKQTLPELLEARKAVHCAFVVSISKGKYSYTYVKGVSSAQIEKAIVEKTIVLVFKNEIYFSMEFALAQELAKGQQVSHPLKQIKTVASVLYLTDHQENLLFDELHAYLAQRAAKELRRVQRRFSLIRLELQQEANNSTLLLQKIHKYIDLQYFSILRQSKWSTKTNALLNRSIVIVPRALLAEFKKRKK